MPRGYWIAIGAALGFTVFGLAAYGYQKLDAAAEHSHADLRYQPSRDATFPKRHVAGQAKTQAYDPNCQQPQNESDADLCSQWSAVEAANEANQLARLNLKITGFGLGVSVLGGLLALIGTYLVWRSLVQGQDGLRVAAEANRITREQFAEESRPFLLIETCAHTFDSWRSGTTAFDWGFKAVNYGSGPALLDRIDYTVFLSDSLPTETGGRYSVNDEFREIPSDSRSSYGYGRPVVISKDSFIGPIHAKHGLLMRRDATIPADVMERRTRLYKLTAGTLGFYLIGKAFYRDIRNVRYETNFCFRCVPPFGNIHEAGGAEYNRRT